MSDEGIPSGLQENILALLAFDEKHGPVVSWQLDVKDFDLPYQYMASKLLDYWRRFKKPPGPTHFDDILADALERGDRSEVTRRIVNGIFDLGKHLNAEYVAGEVQTHIKSQHIKTALQQAGERWHQGGSDRVADVERIMHDALHVSVPNMDMGIRLGDADRALAFLDTANQEFIPTGMKELDRLRLGAIRKELLLFIAPKGSGKTWFCVHMGVQGLQHQKRVLHISLEFRQELIAGRYFQRMFGGAMDDDPYVVAKFEFDDMRRLTGWRELKRRPRHVFTAPEGRAWLRDRMGRFGVRLNNLVIKDFPSGALTMSQLEAYLLQLENEGFLPDELIMDYPALMKIDTREFRINLGRLIVELRGLASSRNMALVAVAQGGRKTIGARRVRASDVAEDIVQVNTADTVLTYQQTEAMRERNLARLSLEFARRKKSGIVIAIRQAYNIGQFVTQSAIQSAQFVEKLDKLNPTGGAEDGDEAGED